MTIAGVTRGEISIGHVNVDVAMGDVVNVNHRPLFTIMVIGKGIVITFFSMKSFR